MMRQDLTGKTFGRLVVIKFAGVKRSNSIWECVCECGSVRVVVGSELTRGNTTSCGCYQSDCIAERNYKHGKTCLAEYNIWKNIKTRCLNDNAPQYTNYGGRGITLCDSWLSFENFYADMGNRPSPDHSIDRINNELGYSKENCRWATREEQQNNTRRNRLFTYNGITKTLTQWASATGIARGTIGARLRNGWGVDEALTTPVSQQRITLMA